MGSRKRRSSETADPPVRSAFGRVLSAANTVLWLLLIPILIAAIVALFAVIRAYESVRDNLQQVVNIELPQGAQATRVYARDFNPATGKGTLLASLRIENRLEVDYTEIPPLLLACVLSTEDANFYRHKGVDIKGNLRAVYNILRRRGEVRGGGSTITQQLARNVFLPFIKSEKTVNRKIQEIILASELEKQFSKPEILEAYLNHIYLGGSAYGVRTAAETFFAKGLDELTLAECALIAGMPQRPHAYDPFLNPELALERRDDVLRLLDSRLDQGFVSSLIECDNVKFAELEITHEEIAAALKEPLKLKGSRGGSMYYRAPYFCDYLFDRVLLPRYGKEAVLREGMTVVTTIDPQIQEWAEEIVRTKIDQRRKTDRVTQAAVLVLAARTGEVLANVGGYGWGSRNEKGERDMFNRAFLAKRQVGSSFKPFTYATAYEQGFKPSTTVFDQPIEELTRQVGKQYPVNSDRSYRGPMAMSNALKASRNAAAVDIIYHLTGVDAVINTARKMGIKSELDKVPALTLGVSNISPIEMASAYTTFPNMGVHVEPTLLREVYERDNDELMLVESYTGPNAVQRRSNRALTESTAYLMVRNMELAVNAGTGGRARVSGVQIAGKTGTCDDFSDAWFCGYSPEIVCVVWVGNDDFRKKLNRVYGGHLPAEIFSAIMKKIYARQTETAGEGEAKIKTVTYEPPYKQLKFEKPEGVDFPGLGGLSDGEGYKKEGEEAEDEAAQTKPRDASSGSGKTPGENHDGDFYKPWTPPPQWEGTL